MNTDFPAGRDHTVKRNTNYGTFLRLAETIHQPILIPEKPTNAIARIPAHINATGTPFMPLGTAVSSSCSLYPSKNPQSQCKAKRSRKAVGNGLHKIETLCITRMATPSTAQLVVMRGRNTPSDL